MSMQQLERPEVVTEIETEDDDNYDHIVCHCNLEKGWCGAEVDVAIGGPPVLSGQDCLECSALGIQFVETCPSGCSCSPDMRMLNCAGEDEDE